MAVSGMQLIDTGKCGANAATSTSQYMPCYLSAADTYSVVNTTTAALQANGVILSFQSAGSESISVVRFGKAKVKCAASVTAATPIVAGAAMGVLDGTIAFGAQTVTAISQANLGQALEAGITNSVISAWITGVKI